MANLVIGVDDGVCVFGDPEMFCTVCPVCGDTYVHPISIECISPGTEKGKVLINAKGLHLDPEHPCVGRGVAFIIRFACESGHCFSYQFHFHKGVTSVKRESWDAEPETCATSTIWRD